MDWLTSSSLRSFFVIVCIGLALRGYLLSTVPIEYVRPHTNWEAQAVAVSLAQSGEFANPYALPTGPTAHLPPIYPGVIGLIYSVFGLTLTAGYLVWILKITASAAVYGLLPWCADRLGIGRTAGLIGGVAGALIPQLPGHGEALTAIALALLMIAFLRAGAVTAVPTSAHSCSG